MSSKCTGLNLIVLLLFDSIFIVSLSSVEVPSKWKKANVTAVHKKGNRHHPLNYRPISLTSIVCKLLESIVRDHVTEHLIVNNFINPNQHGFVPKRYCMTQQLEALEFGTKTCDQGSCVDIAFMDIQKAYDTVSHKRLLAKLNSLGFETKLLTWIEAFLSHQE